MNAVIFDESIPQEFHISVFSLSFFSPIFTCVFASFLKPFEKNKIYININNITKQKNPMFRRSQHSFSASTQTSSRFSFFANRIGVMMTGFGVAVAASCTVWLRG